MNSIVLAHVKKDVASLRQPLIGWAVCVVLSLLFAYEKAHAATGGLNAGVLGSVSLGLGACLQYLLLLTLIVRVIHEDSLMEPDAFWRTRPIARLELLAAKALFIGALLLVSLSMLAVLVSVPPSAKVWIFLCSLIAFASATPNFTRLLVSFIGIGFAAGFLSALLGHGHYSWSTGAGAHGVSWSLGSRLPFLQVNHQLPLQVILIGGLLAVTFHQYLTLRTKTSLGLLFLLFFTVGLLWGN